jgi:hypothetical protein
MGGFLRGDTGTAEKHCPSVEWKEGVSVLRQNTSLRVYIQKASVSEHFV